MKWTKILLITLLIVAVIPVATAEPTRVISNSNDWRDVYSTALFANLQGLDNNFLVSSSHSTLLLFSIPKSEELLVVSGEDTRFVVGYDEIILGQGYDEDSEELVLNTVNLDLAERLTSINKYIIIDDSYGYNAISVAPYAVVDDYYVLFADQRNIGQVTNFLETKNVEDIILYGQLDRQVKEELAQYNPEIINEGDRFDNNFVIVQKYLEVNPTRQAILTSGDFLESSLLSGFDPVIFIGRANVPEKVKNFVQQSDIDIGILIGNELVGAATTIRRQVGISVFVKFAQGARRPTGAISQVEDLDRFPMPSFDLSVNIQSIVYNQATQSIEVTYINENDIAAYVRGTITIQDGTSTIILADESSFFLEANELKTIVYDQTVDGEDILLTTNDATGEVFAVYGEAQGALDLQVSKTFDIEYISVEDRSELEIVSVFYDKTRGEFIIEVRNVGETGAYFTAEILDLIINGEEITYASSDRLFIESGKTKTITVPAEMEEEDFQDNPTIYVRIFYGERETALIKIADGEFPLQFKTYTGLIIAGSLILLAIILLLLFWRRKCKHCKTKNWLWKTRCRKCKARL